MSDTSAGWVLSILGIICAVVGVFVLEGISIELLGIILGGLGYYFGLRSGDRMVQVLGAAAAILNVISILVSGLTAPPQ